MQSNNGKFRRIVGLDRIIMDMAPEFKRQANLLEPEKFDEIRMYAINIVTNCYRDGGYATHGMTADEYRMFIECPKRLYEMFYPDKSY